MYCRKKKKPVSETAYLFSDISRQGKLWKLFYSVRLIRQKRKGRESGMSRYLMEFLEYILRSTVSEKQNSLFVSEVRLQKKGMLCILIWKGIPEKPVIFRIITDTIWGIFCTA